MKLGIDLFPFFTESRYRGIGRYARGFLEELIRIDTADQFHFLNIYDDYCGDPQPNAQCYMHRYHCGSTAVKFDGKLLLSEPAFDEYRHAICGHFIRSSGIDAMLFLSMMENDQPLQAEWFSGILKIGILYDLIPLLFQQEYLSNSFAREKYLAYLEFVKKMDILLAISETSKKDAVRLLGIAPEKIVVISAGVDPQFINVATKPHIPLREKIAQQNPYLLFVGGADTRKNIAKTIQAFAMNQAARDNNIRFVIVGRLGAVEKAGFRMIASDYNVADRVDFIGYVSDERVIDLYSGAVALLFPSLYEGFGLPVLEAMCCGTAVITSNNSSLIEVAEGYAQLVDANSVESISEGITKTLMNMSETERLVESAKAYAMTYRWERAAQIARQAFEVPIMQYTAKHEAERRFSFDSAFLEAIVQQYQRFNVPFRWPEALALARDLQRVTESTRSEGSCLRTRIYFDVSDRIVMQQRGALIGDFDIEMLLINALMSYAEVTPVVIRKGESAGVLVAIDLATGNDVREIIPTTGDIYFRPDLQERGMDIVLNDADLQFLHQSGIKAFACLSDRSIARLMRRTEACTDGEATQSLDKMLRVMDGVFTSSKSTTNEILQYFEAQKERLRRPDPLFLGYFYPGIDNFRSRVFDVSGRIIKLFATRREVYIVQGDALSLQGYRLILSAFERIWRKGGDCRLCFLGQTGSDMNAIANDIGQHHQFNRKLLLIEEANAPVLEYALLHATALIHLSEGENPLLPMLNAASSRLPVLCSDTPVYRELAGEFAFYFSPNAKSIARCVYEFQSARRKGNLPDVTRFARYTWDDVANRLFTMMEQGQDWEYCVNSQQE